MRISNFLLWQVSYAEFYVTDTLWPDFSEEDMDKAIQTFARRSRRFGNVKPQSLL
jgi:undecaprenyl diphosphate synthase